MQTFDETYPNYPAYRTEVSGLLTSDGGADFDVNEMPLIVSGWACRTWPKFVAQTIQTERKAQKGSDLDACQESL